MHKNTAVFPFIKVKFVISASLAAPNRIQGKIKSSLRDKTNIYDLVWWVCGAKLTVKSQNGD